MARVAPDPPIPGLTAAESSIDAELVLRAAASGQPLAEEPEKTRRRGWLLRRMLVLADVSALITAFTITEAAMPAAVDDHVGLRMEALLFALTLPVWVVLAKLHRLYDHDEERTDTSVADDVTGVLHLVTLGTWVFLAAGRATGMANPPVLKLVTFWAAAILLVTSFRAVARAYSRRTRTYVQRTVIVGAGAIGNLVARKFQSHKEYGIDVIGFVDSDPRLDLDTPRAAPVLGSTDMLPRIVKSLRVERVVIAFLRDAHDETLKLIRELKDFDVQIDIVPRLFEILGTNARLHTVEGLPLLGLPPARLASSSRLLKRTIDLVVSSFALTLLAPLFVAIAAAIKLDSRGPILFRQERMGSGDQTFSMFKFRTMVADAEARKSECEHLNMHNGSDGRMFKIPDDPRVTRVGRVLRRFSLDELPQLVNVLAGQMSLVGPRPLILDEDRHVVDWRRKRLDLRPGMTGLWQVLGASEIPFDEMIRLDYIYVTSWSLWGDARLILQTLPALTRRRSAY